MSEPPPRIRLPEAGEILAGKYRVERVLGKGGMGAVFEATHLDLDERVALKLLLPEVQFNQEALERFAREARASAKLRSEHAARTYDVGKLDNGLPYMVMELLQGCDAAERLSLRGHLPAAQAVSIILQALDAIAEAHALGIVHRDLKPANFFLTKKNDGSESVKVLDFGISKAPQGIAGVNMTRTSDVLGSPLYMAPEQMEAASKVDARSDIWALGVTLYELLTGKLPFAGETIPDICRGVMTRPTPLLHDALANVPAALDPIIQRCTAKNPEDRYRHVGELATALAPFAPASLRAVAARVNRVIAGTGGPGAAEGRVVDGGTLRVSPAAAGGDLAPQPAPGDRGDSLERAGAGLRSGDTRRLGGAPGGGAWDEPGRPPARGGDTHPLASATVAVAAHELPGEQAVARRAPSERRSSLGRGTLGRSLVDLAAIGVRPLWPTLLGLGLGLAVLGGSIACWRSCESGQRADAPPQAERAAGDSAARELVATNTAPAVAPPQQAPAEVTPPSPPSPPSPPGGWGGGATLPSARLEPPRPPSAASVARPAAPAPARTLEPPRGSKPPMAASPTGVAPSPAVSADHPPSPPAASPVEPPRDVPPAPPIAPGDLTDFGGRT